MQRLTEKAQDRIWESDIILELYVIFFFLINEDLRDREENLNILNQGKTKLEIINLIMFVLSIHVY